MKKDKIEKPIGLSTLCNEIEDICENAQMYKRCGIKPKHLIIPLDAGAGRTTFVEYLADMYREYGIIDFSGALDEYIEVTLDGSSAHNITRGFAKFREGAVYRNEFSNVAVVNIEDMARYLVAPQFADFLREATELCRCAYVVFFISSDPTPNEEKLVSKLVNCIGDKRIRRALVEKYTTEDICLLIEKTIRDHGVSVEQYQKFHVSLMGVVVAYEITEVSNAVEMAEELIRYADFSCFIPTVNDKCLAVMKESWDTKREGAK